MHKNVKNFIQKNSTERKRRRWWWRKMRHGMKPVKTWIIKHDIFTLNFRRNSLFRNKWTVHFKDEYSSHLTSISILLFHFLLYFFHEWSCMENFSLTILSISYFLTVFISLHRQESYLRRGLYLEVFPLQNVQKA